MSYENRIEWKRTNNKNVSVPITDCITFSINKSTEIKNNICQLTLKNSPVFMADDGETIIGKYVDSTTQLIKFDEEDEVRVWADFLTDASLVGTTWYNDDNLLGAFAVEEYQVQTMENQCRIQLKAVDVAYLLFNKIYNFSYGTANNFTTPGIIRQMARKMGEKNDKTVTSFPGTDNDTGVRYAIDAKFVSEGGYITDYRDTSNTLNGSLSDSATTITVDSTALFQDSGTLVIGSEHIAYTGKTSTTFTGCVREIDDTVAVAHSDNTTIYQGFPLVVISKIWKAIFEWVSEISQVEYTNYLSETQEGGTYYYNRAFLFWVDKNNATHLVYPDDTVDLTIDLSEEGRRSFRLDKAVFDAVNFIVYNCGEDMYGNGIIHYLYDDTSEVASLKMRYQPMSKIVYSLIDEDLKVNTVRNTAETDIYKQFPASYTPAIIPSFLDEANTYRASIGQSERTNVASDSQYNDCLREACKQRGFAEARKITTKRSGLRYKGQLVLKGTHINPGDLVKVTNPFVGMKSQLLRVTAVNHQGNANGFETTIDVEEDEKAL